MKPVTDPALLAELGGSRRPVKDPEVLRALGAAPRAPSADSGPAGAGSAPVDLAEDMPWYEKVLTGVGGGMRNVYLGGKELIGQGTPEEKEERELWKRSKKDLGGWGTTGEIIGEGVATLPVGGAVGSGAKVLSKAVPALSKVAPSGSWRALAARGGAEGAASNVLAGDGTVAERAEEGGTVGAVAGSVLPKALKGIGRVGRDVVTELSPSTNAATIRGAKALERTLGKDILERAVNQVENPTPSILPRTTAAMSNEPRLGALERGARNRGNVDFSPHDEAVSRVAWDEMKAATRQADDVEALRQGGSDIMAEGKDLMDKLPLSQDRRKAISQQVLELRNSNEMIANPKLARELDSVIAAMDNPNATLGVLPQLYWSLGREAGDSNTISKVRALLKNAADERSKGQFTNMQSGYGATMDQMSAAQAAKTMREKLVKDNIPTTNQYYGEAGVNAVPKMDSASLRRSMTREAGDAGGLRELPPDQVRHLNTLADQLRQHDLYKPTSSSGAASLGLGESEGMASAA